MCSKACAKDWNETGIVRGFSGEMGVVLLASEKGVWLGR